MMKQGIYILIHKAVKDVCMMWILTCKMPGRLYAAVDKLKENLLVGIRNRD